MKGRMVLRSGLKAWALSFVLQMLLGRAYPAGTPEWGSVVEQALSAAFMINMLVFVFWNLSAALRSDKDHEPAITVTRQPGPSPRPGQQFAEMLILSGGQPKYVVPVPRPEPQRRSLLRLLRLACPDCLGSGYACAACEGTGHRYSVEMTDSHLIIRNRATVRSQANR
jgi:hypothetical protein